MDWIAIVAERKIQEAMDEGKFDRLDGHGKPLRFDDDLSIPAHQRLAAKVLRNARALPEWIQTEKDLEREQARARRLIDESPERLERLARTPSFARQSVRMRSELKDAMDLVNTLLLRYNALAPEGYQRVFAPFPIGRELARFDEAVANARRPPTTPTEPPTR
ncbi:MAG: DUF1992 domain-containing protein [Armatimonadota bacterium]